MPFTWPDSYADSMQKLLKIESISHMKHRYKRRHYAHEQLGSARHSKQLSGRVDRRKEWWNAEASTSKKISLISSPGCVPNSPMRGEDTSEVVDPATFLSEIVGQGDTHRIAHSDYRHNGPSWPKPSNPGAWLPLHPHAILVHGSQEKSDIFQQEHY
ncbi:MAG: hypothetical protein R2854_19520 [Caldilineaceae bacterium]